jgi:hypothetical protein
VIRKTKGSEEAKMRAAGYQLPDLQKLNPALAGQLSWLRGQGIEAVPPWVQAVLPSADAAAAAAAAHDVDDAASSSGDSDGAAAGSTSSSSSTGSRLQQGFKSLIGRLVPSKAEDQHTRDVVDAVRQALRGMDAHTGSRWAVNMVVSTGSVAKRTNLRRT